MAKIVQFACGCLGLLILGSLGWWLGGMIGPLTGKAAGLIGAVVGFWFGRR